MEWTLFLDNLNALNEWVDDIDIVDCVLVSLVQKYADPSRAPGLMRTEKGHVWINHSYLLGQLPFLKIKDRTLGKKLKNLVGVGILEREFLYPQTDNGVRKNACYRLSEVFIEMCEYYKAIQSVHSNKKLGEQDKQRKLACLLKEKPEIPRTAFKCRSRKVLERDGKGRFRTASECRSQRYLNAVRNGTEMPLIPSLDPNSRNAASKTSGKPEIPAGRSPVPELDNGSGPATDGKEKKSEEELNRLRQRLAEMPDLVERFRAKAHYRELGYDV